MTLGFDPIGTYYGVKTSSLRLFDNDDKELWSQVIPTTKLPHNLHCTLPVAAALTLENCGRAVVFTASAMVWCSCPFCKTSHLTEGNQARFSQL